MSDIRRNIEKLQPSLHFVHWNQQGWKTGLCSVPPIGQVCCLFQIACLSARCFVPPFGKVYLFVFVCLFVFSQSFYTCIPVPHPWRMFVFLKYMPGALPPIGKVYLFVCLLCVFFLKIHVYLYPTHGGFVVYFVPFFEKRYLFKVVCGLSSALLPAHSCKQHLFPTHSH